MDVSRSVADTERLAGELAKTLTGGECIALHGDLGAGKTQFVRGLLTGLGGDPRDVSSPTYVLLNIYNTGRLSLFHLDAYRVAGVDDFESIGFGELLEQGGVVVVHCIEGRNSAITHLASDGTVLGSRHKIGRDLAMGMGPPVVTSAQDGDPERDNAHVVAPFETITRSRTVS